MKFVNKIWIFFFLLTSTIVLGQTPGFNYQALILNNEEIQIPGTDVSKNSLPLSLEDITLRFTITNDAGIEYTEEHDIRTGENGMVSIIVGEGTPISFTFGDINWDGKLKYLNVELNIISNNEGFVFLDSQKILYIPHQNNGKFTNSTIALNGLHKDGDTIKLGGNLIEPTEITTDQSSTLAIKGLQESVNKEDLVVVVDKNTGVLKQKSLLMLSQQKQVIIIATEGQLEFPIPLNITNTENIDVYRNGVLIDFTCLNNSTIKLEPEAMCYKNDKIRIVQLY